MFLKEIRNKLFICDGAMGTMIKSKTKPNELLNITNPDEILNIHKKYIEAGANIIETNSFGGSKLELEKYSIGSKTYTINYEAAQIGKKAIAFYPERNIFLSGSIGPGSLIPSLNQVNFDTLKNSYYQQVLGLIDGGVDLFQIETVQDILQAKAAYFAINEALEEKNKNIPIIIQISLDINGKMLTGTDIETAVSTFEDFDIAVLGVNCGTGPEKMIGYAKKISELSSFPISVLPNAGIPQIEDNKIKYNMNSRDFFNYMKNIAEIKNVQIIGGCCGTDPAYIKKISTNLKQPKKYESNLNHVKHFSSLFESQVINVKPKPLIIGERTNVKGSRQFKKLLKNNDYQGMVSFTTNEAEKGVHLLDINLSFGGRDELKDAAKFYNKINDILKKPVCIDTTNINVLETALKKLPGKSLINSVNLKNLTKADKIFKLTKKYGAGLVCLCMDEKGMGISLKDKKRILDCYLKKLKAYNIDQKNIFIDPLTFSIASGKEEYRESALNILKFLKYIENIYPDINTILGISNVSYGLTKNIRKYLNSVFLYYSVKNGLDAAIINVNEILPLNEIENEVLRFINDIIFNKYSSNYDPLIELINYFKKRKNKSQYFKIKNIEISNEEKLKNMIINGNSNNLKKIIKSLLNIYSAKKILDNILIKAMNIVSDNFESGKTQLPFVLKSAEVMKKSIELIEPHFEGEDKNKTKKSILLTTVEGDIHDIGKNLTNIILSSNGFIVHDMGVDKSKEEIFLNYKKYKPDFIGLSGLLIESIKSIIELVDFLKFKNITTPIICGGAALNFDVIDKIRSGKNYRIYYSKNPFEAIKFMENNDE